jgi:ABC-2 type transport system permease protein
MPGSAPSALPERGVNWIGLGTLCRREIWRFLKVWNQTLFAPMVTTLLFFAVLILALGEQHRAVGGLGYAEFVTPGLIMMAVVQNAFANTSSSLILAKIQGVIVDVLMPPLSAGEITCAYVTGGVTRGVLVALTVSFGLSFFVPLHLHDPALALFFLLASSVMLALLGVLGGLYAQSFDQMAAFTNYLITPLSFLSGTFYSVGSLPEFWRQVSFYNPFFHMIDGFRYALTGHADGSVTAGAAMLVVTNLLLWVLTRHLLHRGWRIKG